MYYSIIASVKTRRKRKKKKDGDCVLRSWSLANVMHKRERRKYLGVRERESLWESCIMLQTTAEGEKRCQPCDALWCGCFAAAKGGRDSPGSDLTSHTKYAHKKIWARDRRHLIILDVLLVHPGVCVVVDISWPINHPSYVSIHPSADAT